MQYYTGRVLEIRLEIYKFPQYLLECPSSAIPHPGQYLQAWSPQDVDAPLATTLFPASAPQYHGELSSLEVLPGERINWIPGTTLQLRGPLGKGFSLPQAARRVALVAVDAHPARLLPLLTQALAQNAAVALFCNEPPAGLPAAVEVNPLSAYKEAQTWGDYTAFDVPIQDLELFRNRLSLDSHAPIPSNAEIMISSPMPCGALAECGVCAFKAHRGWNLACKDGPVFSSRDLST